MRSHVVRLAVAAAVLYAARRYFRNWGTTKEESRMPLVGDDLVARPMVQTTEAVWVDAHASAAWPWLVQIGQGRGGLYSYQTIENMVGLDYRNADRIHPEWQDLAPGDTVRLVPKGWMGLRDGLVLNVVEVADNESIVLRTTNPDTWDGVWSFHVLPHGDDRCRILIRARTRLTHPGQIVLTELAAPVVAFVTRGVLRGLKRRIRPRPDASPKAAAGSARQSAR
jgi:hypothetical protein